MITVTSVEAQNRFGQLLDTVQREPVVITRHGRMAAYMVSGEAYQALIGHRVESAQTKAYLDAIDTFRGQGQGGATERLLADRRVDAAKEA